MTEKLVETQHTYDLGWDENKDTNWTTFELAAMTDTASLGSGITSTKDLMAMQWLKSVVEAGKKQFFYPQVATQETIPEGSDKLVIPRLSTWEESWGTSSEEYDYNAEIDWTEIDKYDTKTITATDKSYGANITNKLVRTASIPYIQGIRDILAYKQLQQVNTDVRNTLVGTHGASTADTATPMSDSAAGLQTIFGGDATNAGDALDTGDILTPAIIKKAIRLLESTKGYYWDSNVWTKSAVEKNPWRNEGDFVLIVAPEQKASLLEDGQFTNAAEFGARDAILTGEIARYLGVKIVVTNTVPSFDTSDNVRCQGADVTTDTDGHVCTLFKAGKCGAIGWSLKPKFHIFPYPSNLSTRLILEMSYGVSELFADAMVNIVVSDE